MFKKSFRASHLEFRYKTFYAILYVPKDVRHALGKTKFTKSTKTSDVKIAQQRADAFVIGWQAEIARARLDSDDPIISEALELYNHYSTSDSLLREHVRESIEDRCSDIASTSEGDGIVADIFKKVATGQAQVLSGLIAGWVEHETDKGLKQKTIDQMKRDVVLLVETFKVSLLLTPEYTEAWIKLKAEDNDWSASSVTRVVANCRNFYRFLQSIGEVDKVTAIPFSVPDEYKRSKKSKSHNKIESWVPFEPGDVVRIYNEALNNDDQVLADLIKIAAYTGARIEEICSLKCSEIFLNKNYFDIVVAKTDAGIRSVPIHPKLKSRVKELIAKSEDGYLLSGLTFNKYNGRSNAIGKRFGRLKAKLGFSNKKVFTRYEKH